MLRRSTSVGLVWVSILAGGCPAPTDQSQREAPVATAIVAGAYAGEQSCSTRLQIRDSNGSLINRSSTAALAIEIDPAGSLSVAGVKIEPGVVVSAATADVTVTQTIDAVTFTAERATVAYTAKITFTVDNETLEFSGAGQYEISGDGEAGIRYAEDTTLAFDDALRGFSAVLRCDATLVR